MDRPEGLPFAEQLIKDGLAVAIVECHRASREAGWWDDKTTPTGIILSFPNIPEKIALIHSEISEALEGYRRDAMDSHLPNRKAVEVELADALHRIFDLAGYLELDLGSALIEKMTYNATRADHKPENRAAPGGKRF